MSSSSSTLLPFLPIELKKEILKFCDPATLAKMSSLSLAFLQLSSPLLYRHVTLEGPRQLKMFFSIVADDGRRELEPYLDLSLVHSLTYIDTERTTVAFGSVDINGDKSGSFFPRRLLKNNKSSPRPLRVQTFSVVLKPGFPQLLGLTTLVNPVVFHLIGRPIHISSKTTSRCPVDPSGWTRLQEMVFQDGFAGTRLLSLQWPAEVRKFKMVYNVTIAHKKKAPIFWISDDLIPENDNERKNASRIESVEIRVCNEGQRVLISDEMEDQELAPITNVIVKPAVEI